MNVGVIVLNYNDYETTLRLIEQIKDYDAIHNIVVVDNCSTNKSFIKLKRLSLNEKVDVIQSDKNGGYAYGNNFGAKYLIDNYKSDIVFIANPDVEFDENVVKSIINQFVNTNYAMISCIMANSDGIINKNPIWNLNSYKDDLIECFIITNYLKKKLFPQKIDFDKEIIDVGILPGSFFGIRTDIFKEVGYFDEGTFLFCEERILARKLHDKKYKIGLITTLSYNHMHSVTINKTFKAMQTQKMIFNSRLYYHEKYNRISKFQFTILKIAMKFSLFEGFILRLFRILK